MNIKHTLKYAEEPSLDELMVVKKANEWIMESRTQPVPKMLFGEFWLEGELAVLSAETGAGKSLLAVQIAESIARGTAIEPLKTSVQPQKVLYLDLKLSKKQFEMRYAEEYDAEQGEFLRKHHKFAANFIRVEIDPHGKLPAEFRSFDEVLPRLVERLVDKTKARVVIIDNITYIQRSIYGYRETYTVMKELDRLKRRLGISILVLARSSGYGASRQRTMGSSSALFNRFADSVFTIGHSKLDVAVRYLKHLTAHSTDKIYDSSHVPSFRITRLNGNFLGFEHEAFGPESGHLENVHDHRDWPTIQKIKEMTDGGRSIREIAAELELPKTTVHRYLQMWVQPVQEAVVVKPYDPTTSPFYFPGREEYDEADRDPRLHNLGEGPEFALRNREGYLIQLARANARKEYKKTGKAPTLAEMKQRMPEWKELLDAQALESGIDTETAAAAADGSESVPPMVVGGLTSDPANIDEQDALCPGELNTGHLQPPGSGTQNGASVAVGPQPSAGGSDKTSGLKRSIDAYGDEIFIEKEDERGKPVLWYKRDKKGVLIRYERKGDGVFHHRVD